MGGGLSQLYNFFVESIAPVPMTIFRNVLKLTGASVTVGTVAGYAWARTTFGDDSLSRIIKYDKVAVPAAIEYK